MQRELAASGAALHVILAWMDDDLLQVYDHALTATAIRHASCISDKRYSAHMIVPGEGHPNGRLLPMAMLYTKRLRDRASTRIGRLVSRST
jgi:hypothetical protein